MKKLSEYKDEEAIVVLGNLLEPMGDIMTDADVVEMFKDEKSTVMQVAQKIISGHAKAVMQILTILNEGEYHCTIPSLIKDLVAVLGDQDLWDFFKSQGQMMASTSSTSALENTEDLAQ